MHAHVREVSPVDTDVVEPFMVVHHWVIMDSVLMEAHPPREMNPVDIKVIVDSVVMEVHPR